MGVSLLTTIFAHCANQLLLYSVATLSENTTRASSNVEKKKNIAGERRQPCTARLYLGIVVLGAKC